MAVRSLITKYTILGLIILILIASFTALSFHLTNRIKGDGKRINLAGRERMLSFEMAWLLNRAMREGEEERRKLVDHVRSEMTVFEEVLYGLRDGSKRYELEPVPHKELMAESDLLIKKWRMEIKPVVLRAMEGSPDAFKEYNNIIYGYVEEIDRFVKGVEDAYGKEIRLYGNLRLLVLGVAIIAFLGIILYVNNYLVKPIKILQRGAIEIGKGNFDMSLDVKTSDEIGVLASEFGRMSSNLKKLYEDLKNKEEQLLQSQKLEAIGTLAAGIAHDFNNILTGIIGYLELIETQVSEQNTKDQIKKVLKIAEKAAELTKQILLMGRKLPPERKPLDINHLIKDHMKVLRRMVEENIDIRLSLAPSLPHVEADLSQITQVIINLVVNARDAMPGGGRIDIKTEPVSISEEYLRRYVWAREGNYVVISVSDTGSGIPEDIRDRIFEPFFTTKEVGKGTGLGLAVTYSIVKNHGGWINLYSEMGKGTEFKVYLPAMTEAACASHVSDVVGEGPLPGGTETILLVDDEEIIRDVGESILKNLGYQVITATNGREAIEVYKDRGPEISLVILDRMMPVMDGIEAYRMLKEINPDVRVLFASGYVALNAHDLKRLGITDILNKPFKTEELAKMVRRVIERS